MERSGGAERLADPAKLNECTHNVLLSERQLTAKTYSLAAVAASLCEARD
jgi:hypothetical protein